jgi:peptide/nickel transport system ATP-binding protein
MEPLLRIHGLRIDVEGGPDAPAIVKDINLTVNRGEIVALIGESGSGKTTICLSAMGYVRPGLKIASGDIHFGGVDVRSLSGQALRDLRGKRIAYVAQSAAAAFNPGLNIGSQVQEPALIHRVMSERDAKTRAVDLYGQFRLPNPETIGRRFPHQVSGGQLQRLMAAMAMCCGPEMIVFDEPTTALDVTTQIDVLKSFKDVIRKQGVAALYVSHNLAVVAQMADRIIVLLNGRIQEQGGTNEIISSPKNEYTHMLMAACDPDSARAKSCNRLMEIRAGASDRLNINLREGSSKIRPLPVEETDGRSALLQVRNLSAGYGGIRILQDINLEVRDTSITGIIGESGSGKTTLGRVLSGLLPLETGEIRLEGKLLKPSVRQRKRDELRRIQMVFQMADTALNPAHTIEKILGRPVEYFQGFTGEKRSRQVRELLEMVQLPGNLGSRRPQELSGGQKQRVNLARAIAANPQIIICDEVTSGLDTVVRMSIIDLIRELHTQLRVTFLFISHDISTIASLANDVVVMHQGKIVERGLVENILKQPHEPYTKILMASVPHMRMGWLEEAIIERDSLLVHA